MKTLILIISLLILLPIASSECLNSADDFSSEVVLNKQGIGYSLEKLSSAKNIIIQDNKYILKSSYNPNLAVILQEQAGLSCGAVIGLSVRLQQPITAEQKSVSYFKFSSILNGKLNISGDSYNGWKISCSEGEPIPQCEFKKEGISILASLISTNKYELTIEINKNLKNCDVCDGRCIIASTPKCIDKELKLDIEDVLKYSQILNNFEEMFASFRIVGTGNIIKTELSSQSPQDLDWSQAMKKELESLKSYSLIFISGEDITKISELSKKGAAGVNSRVVYEEDTNNNEAWLYYYQTKFPTLTGVQNCKEFPASLIPKSMPDFSGNIQLASYYLIPTILFALLLILLLILVFVARFIDRMKNKHPSANN